MVVYAKGPVYKTAATIVGINVPTLRAYVPNLILWGAAAGAGIATFTEGWPLFQRTFFSHIPYFGPHWIHNPDPEDIPV